MEPDVPEADAPEVESDGTALRTPKVILLALIGFFTLAASLAPWLLSRVFKRRALDVVNVFSALAAGGWRGQVLTNEGGHGRSLVNTCSSRC